MKRPEDYFLHKMGRSFETEDVFAFYQAKGIPISERTIYNYLVSLQKENKIQKLKRGLYMKLL